MNKTTKLLVAIFVILVVIVILLLPSSSDREISYQLPIAEVKVDSAAVVKIEIIQPKINVVLENIGGKWEVTSPLRAQADPVAVAQLLNGFSQFKVGSLISSNPDKQKLFQVDSSGTRLTLTDRNGKVTSLIIGKMGPSFSELYFRLPESKDVYLGEGVDTWNVNKSVRDWRDKSILKILSETISDITIGIGMKEYSFKRESDSWRSGGNVVESNTLNPLLNTLSNLRADDFVDTVMEINSKPITVDVKGVENFSLSLYPSLPDSAKYFVRSTKSTQLFVVSKWTVQQLIQPTGASVASSKSTEPNQAGVEAKPVEQQKIIQKEISTVKKETPKQIQAPVVKQNTEPSNVPSKSRTEAAKSEDKGKDVAQPSAEQKKPEVKPKLQPEPAKVQQTPQQPKQTEKKVQEQTQQTPSATDDDGELIVHTVAKGESMTTIAKKYNVTPEKIIKWNLLKSIAVKPGQELYIYQKK
ncbi:MAG: DUF4340 domain-containing protein [Ignavibacteriales bacterium]|nr:DUF4340 domain-containing protein [Ignavibacteriales bacterium]